MSNEALTEALSLAMISPQTEAESDDLDARLQAILSRCKKPMVEVERMVFILTKAGHA
jgi:hypothetical protein